MAKRKISSDVRVVQQSLNGASARGSRCAKRRCKRDSDESGYFAQSGSAVTPALAASETVHSDHLNVLQSASTKLAKLKTVAEAARLHLQSECVGNADITEERKVKSEVNGGVPTLEAARGKVPVVALMSLMQKPDLAVLTRDKCPRREKSATLTECENPHPKTKEVLEKVAFSARSRGKRTQRDPVICRQQQEVKTRKRSKKPQAENVDKVGLESVVEATLKGKGKRKRPGRVVKLEEQDKPAEDDGTDSTADDSIEEWEEVEELVGEEQLIMSQLPTKPVEVFLEVPDIPGVSKRKKKTFDVHAYLRKKWKKFKKDQHESMHKVHLLCFLSYGMQLNQICNRQLLHATAISVLDLKAPAADSVSQSSLSQLITQFNQKLPMSADDSILQEPCIPLCNLEDELVDELSRKMARSEPRRILMFLLLLRCFGVPARLVLAIHPIPWKITDLKKLRKASAHCDGIAPGQSSSLSGKQGKQRSSQKGKRQKKQPDKQAGKQQKHAKMDACAATKRVRKSAAAEALEVEAKSADSESILKPRRSCTVGKCYSEDVSALQNDADDFEPMGRISTGNAAVSASRMKRSGAGEMSEEADDDFSPTPAGASTSVGRNEKKSSGVLAGGSLEVWLEVYVHQSKKWMCVDLSEELDVSNIQESKASQPFTYVLAYDNEGCIKDVTQRYASAWMSGTQKLRVDEEWWDETLAPYRTADHVRDKAEDAQLRSMLEKRPLPASVSEFKGHPLYALKRHLLKFEAIYPETAVPLGYIKGEPIYSRECIHTLHSRETWLKEAKSVRIGEKPYKMVKPRPKMNKPDENKGQATLGVYGSWQVEDYQPPVASEGKVPRNEYGNVEMFKPCMLPVGCVHLPIPALHRVAKKLNIDCAPAMVGWEGYCGYSVPQFDGWVVCEEFKDVLLTAWEQYEAEERRKQHEKKEKRILQN